MNLKGQHLCPVEKYEACSPCFLSVLALSHVTGCGENCYLFQPFFGFFYANIILFYFDI